MRLTGRKLLDTVKRTRFPEVSRAVLADFTNKMTSLHFETPGPAV